MLDDKDIQKLIKAQKEAFKEDFSTRKEIEYLIDIVATKQDLEKLATKEDLEKISTKTDKIVAMLGKMDEKLDGAVNLGNEVEYIKNTLNIPALKINNQKLGT